MRFGLTAVLLLSACVGYAAPAEERPLVEPYGGARLDRYDAHETSDYTLPLSAWRRAAGEWRLEQSERLEGNLQRFTYRIPEGHSPREAHRYWIAALQPLNPTRLFSCRGRGCGPSNQWANAVFDNRELYGLDEQQWYDAFEVQQGGQRYGLALYSVERGNRRVYTHLDMVALDAGARQELAVTADGLLVPLQERGYVVLSRADEVDAARIEALALALQKDSSLHLLVVGHAYGSGPLPALQQRSLLQAERVVKQLVDRGVPARRLEAVGVGPVAPGHAGSVDRVELVRRGG